MQRPNIVLAEKDGGYQALYVGDDFAKAEAAYAAASQDATLDGALFFQNPSPRLTASPKQTEATRKAAEEAARLRSAAEETSRRAHLAQKVQDLKRALEEAESQHEAAKPKTAKAKA